VVKGHHAIIYTSREAPSPRRNEMPRPNESGMLQPIRVKPKATTDRLDRLSRINFAKLYTVEHNVKVKEFGDVSKVRLLKDQFRFVWGSYGRGEEAPEEHTSEEDEEEEEYNEE
jgi:hypothetical protein